MKSNTIIIVINKSPKEIFDFTLNPDNTPKWIDSIIKEEIDIQPPKLESVYKNVNKQGIWSEYHITEFTYSIMFTMTSKDGNYHVRYTFTPISSQTTSLEYYEWVNKGDLPEPFTADILKKLKQVIEENVT